MKFTYALFIAVVLAAAPVRAVYAPIPEQEQGKDLTVAVKAGWTYDSNIFGGATDSISSSVWELAPRLTYNHSLTDQTFLSVSYGLVIDDIERRPGDKLLQSHDLTLRLAHAFNKTSTIDLTDVFMINRNPESLLNGVPLNTDQSFTRNQADARYVTNITAKAGIEAKARSVYTKFRNNSLGRSLDHIENLYGFAGNYAVLPEVKGVAEYRHLDVYYRKLGEIKNKNSNYVMAGADYDVAQKLTLSGRLGGEWRHRAQAPSASSPYVEMSGRYQYAEQSFFTAGYAYTFDEASDTVRFTDQKVQRLFANVQHALTALIVASLSADYEPAILQGRSDLGIANLHETARRFGGALSYMPTKNWILSVTYDLDSVQSDEPSRSVERHRAGLSCSYTF
jgi:hypothetical protein